MLKKVKYMRKTKSVDIDYNNKKSRLFVLILQHFVPKDD